MKSPTKQEPNGNTVFSTSNTTKKACNNEDRNIRLPISDQQRARHVKMTKRDALAKTQDAFFDATQYLYTWPSEQLAFATGMDIRDF